MLTASTTQTCACRMKALNMMSYFAPASLISYENMYILYQRFVTVEERHYHSQAGFVSKLLKQIAKAWKAERGYR